MSRHEKDVGVPTRSSVFRIPNRSITHKSWHRKESSITLRKFALSNVYKYKKGDVASRLTVTSTAGSHPPFPQVTLKANPAQSFNPKPLSCITSKTKEKERLCTNIHVNPLFAGTKSHEKSLNSWEPLPYKHSTCVPSLNASKAPADVKSSGNSLYYNIPSITTNTFNGANASLPEGEENTHGRTTHCPSSTNQECTENRPSIHVNPSVLVCTAATFRTDILKRPDIVNFCETFRTLHNLPNSKLTTVLSHCTNSVTPTAVEPQRLVHVNPAILASKVVVKQSTNAKTSVHVNPKVYARLKSEVRKEKPHSQGLATPSNKSRSLTAGSNSKSLITLSRTKLVRGGCLRSRKLSFRRSQQSIYSTPKIKKVTSSRTPPSAVVKVAKSVCSKYKFIRKSSHTTPRARPISPGAINKAYSVVRTTYKLDRRSQKTPKPLKKVKTYSVRYDNSKRNNTESNLQGIMVHKRLSSSKSFPRASRVWKNPGSLEAKKVVITNRKLFRIGNSPNVKTKRNTSSTHKTLVRLGGVLYKTSRMKLTRTRTPRSKPKSLRCKVESKPTLFRKSNNGNRILHVRGDKFLMDRAGKTLKRISNKPERSGLLKRIDIGGVTFIQKSKNVLIRTNTHNTRNVLSQAKNKSIALLTMRMQKNNTHCRFYRRLGRCIGKEKGRCPCVHDPKYISICKKLLLKGECTGDGCLLSHDMIPEKMPICKFFIQGWCSRDVCAYLHVRSDPDAPICVSFLQGYCAGGSNCRKRHLYVCPQFDKTGKCPKSKYCPYPHKLRENLTVNLEHMHKCVGDIPEVSANREEPKPEQFRYFHLKTAAKNNDLDISSQMGCEELETKGGLLLKGRGKGVEEIDIDLNVAEQVVNRRRLFDDFFNLVHSDLREMDPIQCNNTESMTRVKHIAQELQLDEETLIQTDKETEFQMEFLDRLLSQGRPDFMPFDDDKWNKIVGSKNITLKHREEIRRLLLERAKDRHLKSKVSNCEYTEGFNEFQVVTSNWINYILRQCEVVRVQLLDALALGKIDAEGGSDYQEMYTPTILSTLSLISEVSQMLGKLINTSGNTITKTETQYIDEDSRNYRVPSSLVKLLQNLLSTLEAKQLLGGTDNEHLTSHISHDNMPIEIKSSCTYKLQDCGDENTLQNKVAPHSKSEGNFGIFPCSEGAENLNIPTRRPGVGTIPTYIPLN